MSATAAPHIPLRPSRSQHVAGAATSGMPEVPPRPAHKRLDRSISPSPSSYPHSPLYDPPSGHRLGRSTSKERSTLSLPARPSSVSLPSLGQEGIEYADVDFANSASANSMSPEGVAQMRNIGGDLTLHAPKPSLPQASAKAQVKAVTRTDDQQAAAHGFGKPGSPTSEEADLVPRSPTHKGPSIPRSGSQASGIQASGPPSRRHSILPGEDEQGLPELGLRVPINPNLGDVQAPSPAPFSTIPDHHGPGKKRHHSRSKSGREVYLPPGSYGLHGHGLHTYDEFDKKWYAKHPDQLLHEETIGHGHYSATGSGRGEWALSSDDLNKIVRNTASIGAGLGTKEGVLSYPDEQIGYLASDQYSSRIASPAQGGGYLHKLHSNSSQLASESSLQKTSFPADAIQKSEFDRSKGPVSERSEAVDSQPEEDIIHVDDPARRYNKVTGGDETINEVEDLGPNRSDTPEQGSYIDENGYDVPILASDEVAKDTGGEHLHPAVSPKQERRSSIYHTGDEHGSGNITPSSRPGSRPASIHGVNTSLSRLLSRHEDREDMHTPLEDVDEYEPLFPDEDENKRRPVSAAERFKPRPETLKHRFPSQDIWEETPSSAMHVTTVSTQDLPAQNDSAGASSPSRIFEDPSVESARKGEVGDAERAKLIPSEEKSKFAPHLRDDMPTRPNMQQRFPSRDIWEDTPDSMQLVTTVASPPTAGEGPKSPEDVTLNKPSVPPRPSNRSKLGEISATPSVPVPAEVQPPPVPARPSKRIHAAPPIDNTLRDGGSLLPQASEENTPPADGKKVPALPDRPKPQVPARTAKKELSESVTNTVSGGSSTTQDPVMSPAVPRSKPALSGKAIGKKANLPTSFMSDLNQRLQLGPRQPLKEKEPEPAGDKVAPLLPDARKSRARGPQRRTPAKPSSGSAETGPFPAQTFTISAPRSLWSLDEEGGLMVNSDEKPSQKTQNSIPQVVAEDLDSKANSVAFRQPAVAAEPLAPTGLALNTAGDSVDPSPIDSGTETPATEKSDPLNKSMGSLVQENREGFSDLSEQTTTSRDIGGGAALERVQTREEESGNIDSSRGGTASASDVERESLSKATTATSTATGETLEKVPAHEPRAGADEKASETVSAADAGTAPVSQKQMPTTKSVLASSGSGDDDVGVAGDVSKQQAGEDSDHVGTEDMGLGTESGLTTNIPNTHLEGMTAMADGKGHAAEEERSRQK